MAKLRIEAALRPSGASLRTIGRELRDMDGRQVKEIFRRALEGAARPYPGRVRASVLAIPVKEGGKHTGLRARIAACVELSSGTDVKSAYASVWVNPFRMLPDYVTLPLYMEGVKEGSRNHNYSRWRHPVRGHPQRVTGARLPCMARMNHTGAHRPRVKTVSSRCRMCWPAVSGTRFGGWASR